MFFKSNMYLLTLRYAFLHLITLKYSGSKSSSFLMCLTITCSVTGVAHMHFSIDTFVLWSVRFFIDIEHSPFSSKLGKNDCRVNRICLEMIPLSDSFVLNSSSSSFNFTSPFVCHIIPVTEQFSSI